MTHHLKGLKELDDSTKRIWISDIKEFYYNVCFCMGNVEINLKKRILEY